MSSLHKAPDGNAAQKSKDFVLSRDPNKAMQEMMDTIDVLRGVYEAETSALEDANTQGFFSLQDTKFEIAKQYESGIEQILARKDEIRTADPALRNKLEKMQSEFSELAHKNLDALERMQRCTERLGQTLRHAAKDAAQKKRSVAYGETGMMQNVEKKSISMGVSETA